MINIKRRNLFFLLAAVILTACSRTETENTIILNVNGGTSVTLNGKDAVRDITVKASAAVPIPITITLSDDSKEGVATFEHTSLTIDKGETSATTKIFFSALKFPLNAAEKKITVTASAGNVNVQFETATTEFILNNIATEKPLRLEISVASTNINTTDGEGIAKISFSIDKLHSKDLTITAAYDTGLTIDKGNITWTSESIVIPKGYSSVTTDIKVRQGVTGIVPLIFTVSDAEFNTERLRFTFFAAPFPNSPVELCELISLSQSLVFTKTFTVGDYTLTPEHHIGGSYGYEDKTGGVTAKVEEGAVISIQFQNAYSNPLDTYTIAAWVDWNRSGILGDSERVCYKTLQVQMQGETALPFTSELKAPRGTPDGKYYMRIGVYYDDNSKLNRGCGTIVNGDIMDITIDYVSTGASEASLVAADNRQVFVDDQNVVRTFTVARNIATASPITVNLSATSTGSDAPTLNPSVVTIPAYKTTAEASITFKATTSTTSGQHTKTTVKIVSAAGIAISPTANSIVYDVSYSVQPDLPPVKLCPFSVLFFNSIFTETFSVGDYTLYPKHNTTDKTYSYTDLTGQTANIKEGGSISVSYGNQDSKSNTYISAAWVDWNKDGTVNDSERVVYKEWNASLNNAGQVLGVASGTLKAPDGTKAGTYIMRIGSSSKKNLAGGCGKVENADMFDLKINYSR